MSGNENLLGSLPGLKIKLDRYAELVAGRKARDESGEEISEEALDAEYGEEFNLRNSIGLLVNPLIQKLAQSGLIGVNVKLSDGLKKALNTDVRICAEFDVKEIWVEDGFHLSLEILLCQEQQAELEEGESTRD